MRKGWNGFVVAGISILAIHPSEAGHQRQAIALALGVLRLRLENEIILF
jgi:hypothetical protein